MFLTNPSGIMSGEVSTLVTHGKGQCFDISALMDCGNRYMSSAGKGMMACKILTTSPLSVSQVKENMGINHIIYECK